MLFKVEVITKIGKYKSEISCWCCGGNYIHFAGLQLRAAIYSGTDTDSCTQCTITIVDYFNCEFYLLKF